MLMWTHFTLNNKKQTKKTKNYGLDKVSNKKVLWILPYINDLLWRKELDFILDKQHIQIQLILFKHLYTDNWCHQLEPVFIANSFVSNLLSFSNKIFREIRFVQEVSSEGQVSQNGGSVGVSEGQMSDGNMSRYKKIQLFAEKNFNDCRSGRTNKIEMSRSGKQNRAIGGKWHSSSHFTTTPLSQMLINHL